jgi:hypothetical protein
MTARSLIYPIYKSLGQSKCSQSSQVVSWQRIYNSLTVTTEHIMPSLHRLTFNWQLKYDWLPAELSIIFGFSVYSFGSDHSTGNTSDDQQWIYANHIENTLSRHRLYCVRLLKVLPRNGPTLFLVEYLLRACLPSRSLAIGLHVTMYKSIISPVVLHGCEAWSLTLREEHGLRVLRTWFWGEYLDQRTNSVP